MCLPRLPLRRASASLGLFCLRRASWSGLARNISLIMRGSSSTGWGVREAMCDVLASGGTWMLLKSRVSNPVGNAVRQAIIF